MCIVVVCVETPPLPGKNPFFLHRSCFEKENQRHYLAQLIYSLHEAYIYAAADRCQVPKSGTFQTKVLAHKLNVYSCIQWLQSLYSSRCQPTEFHFSNNLSKRLIRSTCVRVSK